MGLAYVTASKLAEMSNGKTGAIAPTNHSHSAKGRRRLTNTKKQEDQENSQTPQQTR